MLSTKELSNIQSLISDENIKFDELITKFIASFDNSSYFKICMTLETLIIDHQLNFFQEIAAFYILYYLNKEEKAYSTFSSLILKILKESKMREKKMMLIDLIKDKLNNIDLKIVDYIKSIENDKFHASIDKEINNIINEGYTHEADNKNIYLINPIISEKNKIDNTSIKPKDISSFVLDKNNFKYIEPNYMLYYPYHSKELIFNYELAWIIPGLKHNFIWENNCSDKIKYLIKQILDNGVISDEEINYVISSLKKNPNITKKINLTPKQMMDLIEKDESLSFFKFSKYSYLIPFLKYNPTENSIKVLSKLLTKISVPKSFINNYIKNAIIFYSKIYNPNEKIKNGKFIAYFINKLFENNILTNEDEIPNEINYLFEIDSEEINKIKKFIIENKNKF